MKTVGLHESFGTIAPVPVQFRAVRLLHHPNVHPISYICLFYIGSYNLSREKDARIIFCDKKSLRCHPTTLKVGKTMWISRKVATTFTTCHHVIFYKNGRVYQNILNCQGIKNMLQKMTWTKMFYRSSSIHYKFHDTCFGKLHELKCYIDHHPYTISSMMHRLYLPWAMATLLKKCSIYHDT